METLIKNGAVYTKQGLKKADVLISDGFVTSVGGKLRADGEIIDAEGKIVSPGFIDLHAHLREPGFEHKETIKSGTAAAAAGGYTLVCAMPNLSPVPDCVQNLEMQLEIIRRDALIEVLPYASITTGQSGLALSDMAALTPDAAGFSDDGKGVQSSELMYLAMEKCAGTGRFISAHCEDESLLYGGCVHEGVFAKINGYKGIPSASEYAQVRRDIELVRKTGCRYHVCHVSARESLEAIREAKREGLPVTCEVTPHHALLCDMDISEDSGRFKMNPPLRDESDRAAIAAAMADGTVDVIATDHAPHSLEEKSKGLAGSAMGIVGFETAFSALHTGLVLGGGLKLSRLLEMLTFAPAGILGRPCGIEPGSRADITIIDSAAEYTIDSSKFLTTGYGTPFEGMKAKGRVVRTIFGGRTVFEL